MLLKRNSLSLKSFCKIKWAREGKGGFRPLLNRVLAWLFNPYGDHGQGAIFLEEFCLQAGLKPDIVKNVESVSQNTKLVGYSEDPRRIDVVIESGAAHLVIENEVSLEDVNDGKTRRELEIKCDWLRDNLARNKLSRIILLVPASRLPRDMDHYIKLNGHLASLDLSRYLGAVKRIIASDADLKPEFQCALERYLMFLEIYIFNVGSDGDLERRLSNLKAVLP